MVCSLLPSLNYFSERKCITFGGNANGFKEHSSFVFIA